MMSAAINEKHVIKKRVKRYATIGGFMTSIGGLIFFIFPLLLDAGLKSKMVLEEGNEFMKNWEKTPLKITIKVYVWNIENPIDFANGAKAVLKEKGPYYYGQFRWKKLISWGQNEETVKYWAFKSFYFDPDRSKGHLTDRLTVINVPIYSMASIIKELIDELPLSFVIAPLAFGFVNVFFATHGEGLLKELTVDELLNGYPFTLFNTMDAMTKPLTWFGVKLPDNGMPNNRYGILYTKNFTKAGPFEVYTGRGDSANKFLRWVSFQDKMMLDFYNDPKCNMLNGTDGTHFGKFISKEDTIYLFQSDACKSFHAIYKEDTSVKHIPTYRFVFPKSLFSSPDKIIENKCFCRASPKNYEMCDGIFDLKKCLKGAPLAFSYPHFLHASNKIKNSVNGMHPNILKHESFFDVEPMTGSPLKVSSKLQVNVMMKPLPHVIGMERVGEAVVPYIWIEEATEIDDKIGNSLKAIIYSIKAIDYASYVTALGGLLFLCIAFLYAIKQKKVKLNKPDTEKGLVKKEINNSRARKSEKPKSPMKQNYMESANKIRRSSPPKTEINPKDSINNFRRSDSLKPTNYSLETRSNPKLPPNYMNQILIPSGDSTDAPQSYPSIYTIRQELQELTSEGHDVQTIAKTIDDDELVNNLYDSILPHYGSAENKNRVKGTFGNR